MQKTAKRKKIHAFKSKVRFEQLEVVQNKRQNAWQQFQTTKGKTKKVTFSISYFALYTCTRSCETCPPRVLTNTWLLVDNDLGILYISSMTVETEPDI